MTDSQLIVRPTHIYLSVCEPANTVCLGLKKNSE